jgi:hypothetical protein
MSLVQTFNMLLVIITVIQFNIDFYTDLCPLTNPTSFIMSASSSNNMDVENVKLPPKGEGIFFGRAWEIGPLANRHL